MRTNSFAVYQLAVYGQKCKMLNHFSFSFIYLFIYLFIFIYLFYLFIIIYLFIFLQYAVRITKWEQSCKMRNLLFCSVRTDIQNAKPFILQCTDRTVKYETSYFSVYGQKYEMQNQLFYSIRTDIKCETSCAAT